MSGPKMASAADFQRLRDTINGTGPAAPSGKGGKMPGVGRLNNVAVPTPTALGTIAPSKHEAKEIDKLAQRQMVGQIANLRLQENISLCVNNEFICHYRADATFLVLEEFTLMTSKGSTLLTKGQEVVLDAKGKSTEVYRLKKKMMKAIRGIEIIEV